MEYYRESTPSQGWAAEDLARGYDMLVNGGTGAEDYLRESSAWGMPLEAIRQAVENAAAVNRQREQAQLAYRGAYQKAMLDALGQVLSQRYMTDSHERMATADRESKLKIAQLQYAKPQQSAYSGLEGGNRSGILERMKASGLNPQDIATIDKLRNEGRENEINPQIYRQYVDAREGLASAAVEQKQVEKGPKRTLTDQAKLTISGAKGMSEADKGAFMKYYGAGDLAGMRSVTGGQALLDALERPAGQKNAAQPKQPRIEPPKESGPSSLERLGEFLSPGAAYADAPQLPQITASPLQPFMNPDEPTPFGNTQTRPVMPADARQFVRDPNSTTWRQETPEELKANQTQNPMRSYFQPLDQNTINRLNSTDEYGRNLDAWGNPLTNARGEMLSKGETYSQPIKAYGGVPEAGREAYLRGKLAKAHNIAAMDPTWASRAWTDKSGLQDTTFEEAANLASVLPLVGMSASLMRRGPAAAKQLLLPSGNSAFAREVRPERLLPEGQVLANDAYRVYPQANIKPRFVPPEGPPQLPPGSNVDFAMQGPRSPWTPYPRPVGTMPPQLPPGQGFTMGGARQSMPPGSPLVREFPGAPQAPNYTPPWQRQLPGPDYRPVPVTGPYSGGLPLWLRDLLY
jgi:hypothetical protein